MLGDTVDARLFIAAATKPGEHRRILAARGDAAGYGFFGRVIGRVFAGFACEVDDRDERARDCGYTAFRASREGRDGCCDGSGRRSSSAGRISGTTAAAADAPLGHVFGVEHAIATTTAAIVSTQDFLGVVHARVVDTAGTARTARSGTDGGGRSLDENLLEFGHVLLEPRDKLLQIVIIVHL
jgi:hypothetical protein